MSQHEKFNIRSLEDLRAKIGALGIDLPVTEDLSPLFEPRRIAGKTAPNSMAVLPMEGCDSNPDGSPSELVERRYMRFAAGGSGLLWWEANAVVPEGRANELSMMLTASNRSRFEALIKKTKREAADKNGYEPVNILQLTHSGRYSRPEGHIARPLVPQHDPILDKGCEVIVSDDYLDALTERYVQSALLAREVGFDGVDIKSCHRYLLNELLASYTRPGKYGGSFENRTRFLRQTIRAVREAVGEDFIIASRFNVFDAHPYPYGFGCDHEDMWKFDPAEPIALVRMMVENGVSLLSNSAGNPYYIYPQVTRPFDKSSYGIPTPQEHPLESIARLIQFTKTVQDAAGDVPVVGNGYTWLRQFIPNVGAASLALGRCAFLGLGRSSFAYPDAPRELLRTGRLDPAKCCITCSMCTQIMRDHGTTGCVIRDGELYAPLYRQFNAEAVVREHRT